MPSLSERLKALGVQVGESGLTGGPRRAVRVPVEAVIEGQLRTTPHGESFVTETVYPLDYRHGAHNLTLDASLQLVAAWAGEAQIAECRPEEFAFLDTETTGLAGGSGTYAFMVGVGRFEEDGFRLVQFFLRDPAEEPALLHLLEEFLGSCRTLVTFNGKAFDVPLLQARYITNGSPSPLNDLAQLDLLHLARRLWRERLPSRTLGYLEEHIIGETRSEEDTPGWMIPQLYFDYLREGDARPLKGVFYHNLMDVLTMVTLTNHIGRLLEDPLDGRVDHALDLVAIARLHEDLGYQDQAALIFERGLEQELPAEIRRKTVMRLAYLHRRRGELTNAVSLWWQAAAEREVYAHEELAKYFEHQKKDILEALKWTEAALALLAMPETPGYERIRWEDALKHRLNRLERKAKKKANH